MESDDERGFPSKLAKTLTKIRRSRYVPQSLPVIRAWKKAKEAHAESSKRGHSDDECDQRKRKKTREVADETQETTGEEGMGSWSMSTSIDPSLEPPTTQLEGEVDDEWDNLMSSVDLSQYH